MTNYNDTFRGLQDIKVRKTRHIKVSHRYTPQGSATRSLVHDIEIKYNGSVISAYELLNSIYKNIVAVYLQLQSNGVTWNSVSITYPGVINKKYDLIKIPLSNVKGICQYSSGTSFVLEHNLRFTGHPVPISKKIYGIDPEDNNLTTELIEYSSMLYKKIFSIENTMVTYRLVHPYRKAVKKISKLKPKKTEENLFSYKKPYYSFARIIGN